MLVRYRCKDCKGEFELESSQGDYDATYCPYCGSEALEGGGLNETLRKEW